MFVYFLVTPPTCLIHIKIFSDGVTWKKIPHFRPTPAFGPLTTQGEPLFYRHDLSGLFKPYVLLLLVPIRMCSKSHTQLLGHSTQVWASEEV